MGAPLGAVALRAEQLLTRLSDDHHTHVEACSPLRSVCVAFIPACLAASHAPSLHCL